MYAMSGVVDTVHLRKSHVQSLRGAVVLDDQTPLGFLLLTLVFYATPRHKHVCSPRRAVEPSLSDPTGSLKEHQVPRAFPADWCCPFLTLFQHIVRLQRVRP